MKKNIEEYPLIKQELEDHTNIKSYCISTLKDNYIFPIEEEGKDELVHTIYDLDTWINEIKKLNWNY